MNKKIWLINIVLLMIMVISSIIQYNASSQNMMAIQMNNIEKTEQEMEWIIENSVQQLEIVQFLIEMKLESDNQSLFHNVVMHDSQTYYVPTDQLSVKSSLTGFTKNNSLSEDTIKEINVILDMNQAFERVYNNIPDIRWIYYTSKNGFLNMYPFISIEDYHVDDETLNYTFYQIVTPENNPDRKQQWTDLYEDQVTGDWMITISIPIYANNVFRGVLSIDYKFDTLSAILNSYSSELENFIIFNQYNNVIAKYFNSVNESSIPQDFEALKSLDGDTVTDTGEYFIKCKKLGRQPLYIATFIDKSLLYLNIIKQLAPILIFIVASMIIVNLYYKSISVNQLLSSSEKQFKALFNRSPQFIIIMNGTGELIDINAFALKFIGMTREQVIGLPFTDLPLWVDVASLKSHMDENRAEFQQEGEFSSEIKVKDAKSNDKELIYHLVSLKDDDGKIDKFVVIGTDVTDQKNLQSRLENMTRTDILTQSLNRRGILEVLDAAIENLQQYQIPFAVAIGDIDFFKAVNDNYGHECGDELLLSIVRVMEKSIRHHDVIGRWGGEEFIIILEEVTHEKAFEIIDRIREHISSTPFRCVSLDEPIFINITFGFTMYDNNYDFKANIAMADTALYHGKRNGRNQTVSYAMIRDEV